MYVAVTRSSVISEMRTDLAVLSLYLVYNTQVYFQIISIFNTRQIKETEIKIHMYYKYMYLK